VKKSTNMLEPNEAFHRRTAAELVARYDEQEQPPEGWREALAWHWEQAGAHAEATDVALDVAEAYVGQLAFPAARQWAERALMFLDKLDPLRQRLYELRAYALTLTILEFAGQYREGLDYARRLLRAAQARNNRPAEARALLAIGRMQRDLGQLTDAEAFLQQARSLADRDELTDVESEVRIHLAKVHQLQGRHLEALQELQLAREEHEARDDRVKLAQALTGVGDVYRVLGSVAEALELYTRALHLEEGVGSWLGQAILREKMALAQLALGRLDEAQAAEAESLRIREAMDDIIGQARSYMVLGMICEQLGDYQQALTHFEHARTLDEQTQNERGLGVALIHLGDAHRALNDYETARGQYLRALALAQRAKDQLGLARTLERLGDLCIDEGQRDLANGHWAEALKIRESLGHADEAAALRDRLRTRS
jgi:tetratricopeptide (TPR) repeat protein